MSEDKITAPVKIVGIGASAGGLKAIESLFSQIPADTGMAFIVIQHLSPDFKSMMPELLKRYTDMQIIVAEDGVVLAPNTIYLNQSRINLNIEGDKIVHTQKGLDKAFSMPIDTFFHSLGSNCKDKSVAIVLSGTGTDGSRGILTVKEEGGLVYAQSPDTCQFEDMPKAAILSKCVDFILSPTEIANSLHRILKPSDSYFNTENGETDDGYFQKILQEIRKKYGVDFSSYKENTLQRRIEKHMYINDCESLEEYFGFLKRSEEEVDRLYNDLLICVTSFFRDKEAFEELSMNVLPELCSNTDQQLRIWVPGCATGEEAYSLAILIDQFLEQHHLQLDYKIFATDIFAPSIEKASAGLFDFNIENEIDDGYFGRYFHQSGNKLQVEKGIRNKIVFSVHDVLRDPPFISIDFISCRNLLIYLRKEAQERVKKNFLFSLRKGGFLMLGSGESLGTADRNFEKVSAKWKIWKSINDALRVSGIKGSAYLHGGQRSTTKSGENMGITRKDKGLLFYKYISDQYAPPILFVDESLNILFVKGDLSGKLKLKEGLFEQNVSNLSDERFVVILKNGIRKASVKNEPVMIKGVAVVKDNTVELVDLTFRKVNLDQSVQEVYSIAFGNERIEKLIAIIDRQEIGNETAQRIAELEEELKIKDEELHHSLMLQEASSEELQSTNEELMSSNEELQSTNEELQSVNEELYSVNSEMQQSNQELIRINDEITNLFNSTSIATIILDGELKIRKFTPAFKEILLLHESDIGRSFESFALHFEEATRKDIWTGIYGTLKNQHTIRKEVMDEMGNNFVLKINPFLNHLGAIDGVVVSFVNVNDLKITQQNLDEVERKYQLLFNVLPVGILHGRLIMNEQNEPVDCEYLDVNPSAEKLLGMTNLSGKRMAEVFAEAGSETLKLWLDRIVATAIRGEEQVAEEYYPEFEKHFLSHRFTPKHGEFASIFTDITALKHAEIKLNKVNQRLNLALEITNSAVWELDLKTRKIINCNDAWHDIFEADPEGPEKDLNLRIHEDDRQFVQDKVVEHLQGKFDKYDVLFRLNSADGTSYKWIHQIGRMHSVNEDGSPKTLLGVSTDVTKEMNSKFLLEKERKFNLSITQNSTSGIYIYNPEKGINTYTNKRYEEILGWSADEINQMSAKEFMSLFHPDDVEKIRKHMAIVINKKKLDAIKYRFKTKEGKFVSCYSVDSPFEMDEDGNVISFLGTFVDVTELEEAERATVEARDKAIRANQLKDIFLSNISHEIRTPMNAVIGFSNLLKKTGLSVEKKNLYLEQINENSKSLLRLIDDLLEVSRLKSGEFELIEAEFDLCKMMEDVVELHRNTIADNEDKRDLTIILDAPSDSKNRLLNTDPIRLQQVLNNLIINAIKYSNKGEIRVKYRVDTEKVYFSVSDEGIGIDENLRYKIFDRFIRVETNQDIYEGIGLGLSICHDIINKMGGQITVESMPGKGSEFSFWIPEGHVAVSASRSQDMGNVSSLAVHKLLFVDDSPSVHLYVDGLLADMQIEIIHAYDGEEALEKIKDGEAFDIILLDIQMPNMSGEETLQEILKLGITTPVVAQTAFAMHSEVQRYRDMGFADVLTKPLDEDRLLLLLGMKKE